MAEREFVLPSETSILGAPDIERAREICDAIVTTVEYRRAYVEENSVDPAFAYPGANWACDDGEVRITHFYREMCRLDPEIIARLRAVGPFFHRQHSLREPPWIRISRALWRSGKATVSRV